MGFNSVLGDRRESEFLMDSGRSSIIGAEGWEWLQLQSLSPLKSGAWCGWGRVGQCGSEVPLRWACCQLSIYSLRLQSCSLSTLQARLKVAAHQAEEESEETAEGFLEGRTDIDEFLASFMEKRTVRVGWCDECPTVEVLCGALCSFFMFVLLLSFATAEELKRRSCSSPSMHMDPSPPATRR